jgi:hypothetical protein
MLLYKKIEFDQEILEIIKNKAIEHTKNMNSLKIYVGNLPLSSEEWNKINSIFRERGLSDAAHILYIKKTIPKEVTPLYNHVDMHPISKEITNAAFVIPIYGYEDTEHYWWTGDYKLEYTDAVAPTFVLKWQGEPILLDKFKVTEGVWLTNSSIPHNAHANGDNYRLVCTLRLTNNESMEEIFKKFNYGSY